MLKDSCDTLRPFDVGDPQNKLKYNLVLRYLTTESSAHDPLVENSYLRAKTEEKRRIPGRLLIGTQKRILRLIFDYSQTCVQQPPLGPQNRGR